MTSGFISNWQTRTDADVMISLAAFTSSSVSNRLAPPIITIEFSPV